MMSDSATVDFRNGQEPCKIKGSKPPQRCGAEERKIVGTPAKVGLLYMRCSFSKPITRLLEHGFWKLAGSVLLYFCSGNLDLELPEVSR